MRFAKVWELFRKYGWYSKKGRQNPAKEESRRERPPRYARTGIPLSDEQWRQILEMPWEYFEKRRLELMWKLYPMPVTPDTFRRDLGGKGAYLIGTFSSINDRLYRNRDKPMLFRVEGEGEGFQVFNIMPTN